MADSEGIVRLNFDVVGGGRVTLSDHALVVAGYTGRDAEAVAEHIRELAAIGVPPPESVPAFYELDAALATQASRIDVGGAFTSGEVEPVLVRAAGRIYLGVGSDHTDRDIERTSVLASKAACPKPVSTMLIEIERDLDWDAITVECRRDGELYQTGSLRNLRFPTDVLAMFEKTHGTSGDLVIFGGTLPVIGGEFMPGEKWEISLVLPDGAVLVHSYTVAVEESTEAVPAVLRKPTREFFPVDSVGFTPCVGVVPGLTERVLAVDEARPDVATRILRFAPDTDTTPNGIQSHDFWEEVYILSGSMIDLRLGETFVAGQYACRPPGMDHGPWVSGSEGCLTFEVRYRQP